VKALRNSFLSSTVFTVRKRFMASKMQVFLDQHP
jgi:hypothetical protein